TLVECRQTDVVGGLATATAQRKIMLLGRSPLADHHLIGVIYTYAVFIRPRRIEVPITAIYGRIISPDGSAVFFLPLDRALIAFALNLIECPFNRRIYALHGIQGIFQAVHVRHFQILPSVLV